MWIAWCGIWCDVECFAMPAVGWCALFILMWLWCGLKVRCRLQVRCRLCDMVWCHMRCQAMSPMRRCGMWWCGLMVWYMWHMVVCCNARCEMWLWNTERCGIVWCHIRHSGEWWLKCSVGCGAVWSVWCGIVWFIFECGDVHGVVRGVMRAWCGNVRRDVVIWCELLCDVKCGTLWNVAISVRVWLKCKMCYVDYAVMWNVVSWYVKCCLMQNV